MDHYHWTVEFEKLFNKAVSLYRSGKRGAETYFGPLDLEFLASIGCTDQELYDFAEDWVNHGEPHFCTTLLIAAARRDYFLYEMDGKPSGKTVETSSLPAKTDKVDGIEWLPRILQKARLKLRGEMDKDLMFGCGGDRNFLKAHDIAPADFLRFVWAAGADDRKIIDFVKSRK